MTAELIFHGVEIFILGVPLWWGAIRLAIILREYPPHRHDNGHILYPAGYEPGAVQKIGGLGK